MGVSARALFQSFLPVRAPERAYVWKFSWQFGGRRPLHFHAEPELNLVVSGSATFRVGTTVLRATRGDLIAFAPGQDHELLDTSPDVYLFAFGMDPKLATEVLRDDAKNWALPQHVQIAQPDFQTLVSRAESLVERTGIEPLAAEFWEHAYWLRHKNQVGGGSLPHVTARRALSLIAEHPEWDADRVAQKMHANAGEMGRHFHRNLGMTLVKYRTRMRLMQFIRLVDNGQGDLMKTAEVAGFGSYSQCHRVFQSELGCQPRQFFQPGFREKLQQIYAP